jgi:hypothetical protein
LVTPEFEKNTISFTTQEYLLSSTTPSNSSPIDCYVIIALSIHHFHPHNSMNVNPNQQSIELIADCAMVLVLNKRPYTFQKKAIAHLLKMINCTIHPQAILVVQSTSGGKSAIPQTTAVTDGGVTIILENTLALSADQHSKIEQLKSDKIFSFHLDTVKSKADKESLSLHLTSLLEHDN